MSDAIFWVIIGMNIDASLQALVRGNYGWLTFACDVGVLALVVFHVWRRSPSHAHERADG